MGLASYQQDAFYLPNMMEVMLILNQNISSIFVYGEMDGKKMARMKIQAIQLSIGVEKFKLKIMDMYFFLAIIYGKRIKLLHKPLTLDV